MNHYRVRTSLLLDRAQDWSNGRYSADFKNKLDESADYFRAKILTTVNEHIQEEWSVLFTASQLPQYDYFVDIFTNEQSDALMIRNIISSKIEDKRFFFFVKPFSKLH